MFARNPYKKMIALILALMMVFAMAGCSESEVESSQKQQDDKYSEFAVQGDWAQTFEEKGFTQEEIEKYAQTLSDVGITDLHDVDVVENGIMHIIRGKIFDLNKLQLNIILENRKIINIELAGIPTNEYETYINWRGQVKIKTEASKTAVTLFYDIEGGIVAVFNREEMSVSEYKQ